MTRSFHEHPAARLFVEAPKPAPQSFATESYYAVDAFRFVNREGQRRFVRYRILPVAGERHLDSKEAANRSDHYLFDELRERLGRQPVEFRLMAQLAADDDPIDDPTLLWPEDRRQLELGRLTITKISSDNDSIQRTLGFDPARLPDGVGPGDPLIEVRSAIYAIAVRQRRP